MTDEIQRSLGRIEGKLDDLGTALEDHRADDRQQFRDIDTKIESVRKYLTEQIGTYPKRSEHDELANRIATSTSRLDKLEGRGTGLNAGWGYLAGLVGLAAAVWEAVRGAK